MPSTPSKYAANQFDAATKNRLPLMSEVLRDAFDRITVAEEGNASFGPALTAVTDILESWNAAETALANAEAAQAGATPAVEDKLASLTRKPNLDTNSILETWDLTIRAVAPVGGSVYLVLLPKGRETLTLGTIDERIDAIRDFGVRLSEQTGQVTLTTLASAQVTPFATAARALRTAQGQAMATVDARRTELETLRDEAAEVLYGMVGLGMQLYQTNPVQVDDLFDVNLLRDPALAAPAPPADTLWDYPTRFLSTTAMPLSATRLEAWRLAGGGAPERLAVGDPDETTVHIPAMYLFDSGEVYDLWLTARNSKGTSAPGPMISWTAP